MKILLISLKSTRTAIPRKALLVLMLALPGALWAREAAPEPRDTPEAVRWSNVVPRPTSQAAAVGSWSPPALVVVDWGHVAGDEQQSLSEQFDLLWSPLGRAWRVANAGERAQVSFLTSGPSGEAYTLSVHSSGVEIRAADAAGRFYALMTLRQLLPTTVRPQEPVSASSGRLDDAPRFGWRGLMLDSSRHLQSVATLKTLLQLMALHKLNRFHWHLTDDQGWRLPVKNWPLLTEVGAWRIEADGRRYGGYYSEAEIRDVVAYASRRHIVVIPEIDLPGHASAALAAYPELSANGAARAVPLDWGVADGVLSIGRATVNRFVSDVLASTVALFPGPWIHWGGDEVYRNPFLRNAESQAWMKSVKASTPEQALAAFWSDLARRTLAAGRVPMGWDEAALYGSPTNTVIQWWDDPARALSALRAGHPVVASWKETTYLDYPELDSDGDRAFWMPSQTLETLAAQPFWPPATPSSARALVLGVEATLFTERVTEGNWGRKLFPRLALVADLAWTGVPGGAPGWSSRVLFHRQRLEGWGVGMFPAVR